MSVRLCHVCGVEMGRAICIVGKSMCGMKCYDTFVAQIRQRRPDDPKDGDTMKCINCQLDLTLNGKNWLHQEEHPKCQGNVEDILLLTKEEREIRRLEAKMEKADMNKHHLKYFLTKKGRNNRGDGGMGQFLFMFEERKYKDDYGDWKEGESSSAEEAKKTLIDSANEIKESIEGKHPTWGDGDAELQSGTMNEHREVGENINKYVSDALLKGYIVLDLHSFDERPKAPGGV